MINDRQFNRTIYLVFKIDYSTYLMTLLISPREKIKRQMTYTTNSILNTKATINYNIGRELISLVKSKKLEKNVAFEI